MPPRRLGDAVDREGGPVGRS